MSMIQNDWLDAIQPEFSKPYYKELFEFVKQEYSNTVVYPPADDIFNAFHFTPLSKVKVLILGQDPTTMYTRHMVFVSLYCLTSQRYHHHYRIFTKKYMMI